MRRGRLGTEEQYICQARTVAGGSLLASIAALGGVGVGMWLLIYSQDFVQLLGLPLRDAFAGYSVFATYMLLTGMVGAVVSLKRTSIGLLIFAAFLSSNIACQGSIFSYLIIESKQVMDGMNSTILRTTNCRVFDTLVYKFHCRLERIEYRTGQCQLDVESGQTDLQLCSKSVNDWLTRGVWSAVAVSAILMAFQLILVMTSLMLRHMIAETANYRDCCCPWQHRHNKTSPAVTLIDVTPATTSEPSLSDSHPVWYLKPGGPFIEGPVDQNFRTPQNQWNPHRSKNGSQRTRQYESTNL